MAIVNQSKTRPAQTPTTDSFPTALLLLGCLGFVVGAVGATLAMKYGWVVVPLLLIVAGGVAVQQTLLWMYHVGVEAGRRRQS